MPASEFGLIGLGTMGANLVYNLLSSDIDVSAYDISEQARNNLREEIAGQNLPGDLLLCQDMDELCSSLKKPRRIMLMVGAGEPVEEIIEALLPLLSTEDIIIDGGNSNHEETSRRQRALEQEGIRYIGAGISGGAKGARKGPSIMMGGDSSAFADTEHIFEKISASSKSGSCHSYFGQGGSGHFVKMVHNGIEYAIMQMIADIYYVMKKGLKLSHKKMSRIFRRWNEKEPAFLSEITADILEKRSNASDQKKMPLLELISDRAEQSGTGRWCVEESLKLNVPLFLITNAVHSRITSLQLDTRNEFSRRFEKEKPVQNKSVLQSIDSDKKEFISKARNSLQLGMRTAYAEGIRLLQIGSEKYNYEIEIPDTARTWSRGCIIRSSILSEIEKAYEKKPALQDFLIHSDQLSLLKNNYSSLLEFVSLCIKSGLPQPGLQAVLNYINTLKTEYLPTNLIQAQRDYFGQHGFERKDKPGTFHCDWQ
ncbi:NADP-dependent phosphogluconate dehydrogenase [Halarsenatibacter silvermanii]|uniref:6-phosphogluconate dehydrogenase, decarboxylating n=1 Tax=Halarsenatibacter silvermanii TaxID=321763 RepID=A0A1G9SE78_9FIRM|nr:NADP-dependent phosphogluconate dehydrogenase [Halarsenatibacter silvermanii]SDM33774.1 6-phosphogluconate dehydrogenase [Halarsenatibacter silvermanii]